MKIIPMKDYVLLEDVSEEVVTSTGIILSAKKTDASMRICKVIDVGSGRILDNGVVCSTGVSVGDDVLVRVTDIEKVMIGDMCRFLTRAEFIIGKVYK